MSSVGILEYEQKEVFAETRDQKQSSRVQPRSQGLPSYRPGKRLDEPCFLVFFFFNHLQAYLHETEKKIEIRTVVRLPSFILAP